MAPEVGEHWEPHFSMNRAQSQGSIMSHSHPLSRPGTADPLRTRSGNALSRAHRRPRSRGSTASIHSTTTQQTQDQHMGDGFSPFMPSQQVPPHGVFNPSTEDMMMRFNHQMAHSNSQGSLDVSMHDAHGSIMARPEDYHGMPNPMSEMVSAHGIPSIPVSHYGHVYDASGIDSHVPDRTGDENDNSEAGTRKKRGSSSTIANDNELRKLLRQYEGYTLKQMATEVQKHEGAGGKSEKVKQVFAMIWLKENCRKSSGSVRRDRVYCCYAERCGSEHVSVLNPASFGKLVRIIFPNVQTRRLGVRGESKYHYVDLTVIEETNNMSNGQVSQEQSTFNESHGAEGRENDASFRPRSISVSQQQVDTAVFPSPTTSFPSKFPKTATNGGCSCDSGTKTQSEQTVTLDNISTQSGQVIYQLLSFPESTATHVDNDSFKISDVTPFLPANTDTKVADALAALYRTHCISVIDSFRFCKERNLFKHFSAFHGTLTVPVQKLLIHPNLAPWIKECDWLMYQKMIEFVAPLTTQIVPQPVLDSFGSISRRLAAHISETFKSHPIHVSLARLAPAHLFCNLLKHMLDVNQAANAAAAWLCHPDNRNQMWLDFATFVDPKEMMMKARIPACAEKVTEQILRYDVRALLTPLDTLDSPAFLPFYQQQQQTAGHLSDQKGTVESTTGDEYNFPDRWISFILNLPSLFPNHRAQCIVDKVDRLWDCVLHRLTLAGAPSFSAWWMTKVFFHEMLLWQVEKGGFMKHTPSSFQSSSFPSELNSTSQGDLSRRGSFPVAVKNESFVEVGNRVGNAASKNNTAMFAGSPTVPQVPNHDDSGIALDDDSMLMSVGK